MKFTVTKSNLCHALAIAERAVDRRSTMPILTHAKLETVDDTRLIITGTDLEVAITVDVREVQIEEPGSIALPATRLLKYCSLLPEGDVRISTGENAWATITAGRARTRVAGMSADSCPEPPATPAASVSIPVDAFLTLMSRVKLAISAEESRFTLNGALFHHRDDVLYMVATDGHRLALAQAPLPGGGMKFLLPNVAIKALPAALAGAEDVRVGIDDNHIFFLADGVSLVSRKLTGNFPDYERVLPKESKHSAVLDRGVFAAATSRVAQFADEQSHAIRLAFTPGELCVSAASVEAGDAEDSVPCSGYTGDRMEIGFNAGYIREFLEVVDSGEVNIHLINANSAAEFRVAGSDGYRYVLMPMRI